MRLGMRNAWPRGSAAVCTSKPVSKTRVCPWCAIATISGRCHRFLLPYSVLRQLGRLPNGSRQLFPISHTSAPPSPASADDVPIRHALRAVHARATSMAGNETTTARPGEFVWECTSSAVNRVRASISCAVDVSLTACA